MSSVINGLSLSPMGWSAVIAVVGLVGLMFTSYRYVMGYFVVGMAYWLGVEGLHWLLVQFFPKLTVSDSYVLAVAMSLLPILALVWWQPRRPTLVDNSPNQHRVGAGQRPFMLQQDTQFYQHFVRHTSVTEK